jgi:hypothetical protein
VVPFFHARRVLVLALSLLLAASTASAAQECCDPAGPFRPGEGYAETPATCATIGDWAARAPTVDARITLTIRGKLVHVQSDGALAYLIMCEEGGMQVMCVTYQTNGMKAGDEVLFAGGYARVGEKQVMLDPCLAGEG